MLKTAWLIAVVVFCSGLATGEARAENRVDWSEYIETKPTRLTPVGTDDRPAAKKRTAKAKVEKKKKRTKARGKRARRR